MDYKRERCNIIAFRLSDVEKSKVEARLILSGLPKGEYYRKSVLGQEVKVVAGDYMSNRVAIVLERILEQIKEGNTKEEVLLTELIKQLLEVKENAPV
ncbi:MAG: hypothetical protein IKW08_06415 [Roseburia sp.]|nr:hypothetical protein [Roseburia sp.]